MKYMPGLQRLVLDDVVHGQIDLTPVQPIVDSPAMQRLRHVKQLGGAYFIWDDADHSRLSHSRGTAWIAYIRARWLEEERLISGYDVWLIVAAALVHDVGHWAFSHILEPCFGDHNKRGVELVMGELAPYIRRSGIYPGLDPKDVVDILEGRHIYSDLIKPLIGADKLDYLVRDLRALKGKVERFDDLYSTTLVGWDRKEGFYVNQAGQGTLRTLVNRFFENFTFFYEHPNMRVVQRPIQENTRQMAVLLPRVGERVFDAGEDEIVGAISDWSNQKENRDTVYAARHRRLFSRTYPKKALLFSPWPNDPPLDSDEILVKLEVDEAVVSASEGWSLDTVLSLEQEIADVLGLTLDGVSLAVSPPSRRWRVPSVKIRHGNDMKTIEQVMPDLEDVATAYARMACNVIVAVDENVRLALAGDSGAQKAIREILEQAR